MDNKMRAHHISPIALLLALATTACGDDGGSAEKTSTDPQANTVEIYSWWTAGGEAEALSLLIDLYKDQNEGHDVVNSTKDDAGKAFTAMNKRLAENDPPDSWQAILGKNLLTYTQFVPSDDDGMPVEGVDPVNMTEDLTDLYDSEGWTDKIPPGVLEAMRGGGDGFYAVPLSVGRINELFYNKKLFDQYDLSPPQTVEDLWTIGEKLKGEVDADDKPIIPLVISSGYDPAGSPAWPVRFVADAVMMARPGGIDFRKAYYAGEKDADDQMYKDSAADFTKLLTQYTNANVELAPDEADQPLKMEWQAAADMVHSGRAAMFLHGNWVKAYLESKDDVADTDFGVQQFPPDAFVYAGDSFVISKDAPHKEAAIDFLKLIGDPDAQAAFNKKKGALPARTDADTSDYDTIGKQAAADFANPDVQLVNCAWDYPPVDYWSCWEKAVYQVVQDGDDVAFASACVDKYDLLKK
jgi:glucose/mannose transport system substrate-binding protein